MRIREILTPSLIKLNMEAQTKKEALIQLTQLLEQQHILRDSKEFLTDVYLRESQGITGIGDYIAIPHGKSKGVTSDRIAIGIVKQPIEWESIDDLPVKVIILFAVNATQTKANSVHLSMMATVAKALAYDDVKQGLLEATSLQDVLHAFELYEEEGK